MVVQEECRPSSGLYSQVPSTTGFLGISQINSILDQCLDHTNKYSGPLTNKLMALKTMFSIKTPTVAWKKKPPNILVFWSVIKPKKYKTGSFRLTSYFSVCVCYMLLWVLTFCICLTVCAIQFYELLSSTVLRKNSHQFIVGTVVGHRKGSLTSFLDRAEVDQQSKIPVTKGKIQHRTRSFIWMSAPVITLLQEYHGTNTCRRPLLAWTCYPPVACANRRSLYGEDCCRDEHRWSLRAQSETLAVAHSCQPMRSADVLGCLLWMK